MSTVNIPTLCFNYVTPIYLPRKKASPYYFKIYGFLLLDKSEYNKESERANNKLYSKLRNLLKCIRSVLQTCLVVNIN